MTKEEKELVLKDLYARLPYKFTVHRYSDNVDISIDDIDDFAHFLEYSEGEDFKPYLRPMSSMTREEEAYWKYHRCMVGDGVYRLGYDNPVFCIFECFEWLNSHHFDYGGFIEKGLALEAPEGMYD